MSDDEIVYNTKGKSPGSSGDSSELADHEHSPSGSEPVDAKRPESTIETISTIDNNLNKDIGPQTISEARVTRNSSTVRVYCHSMDRKYHLELCAYRRQIKARINALSAKKKHDQDASEPNFPELKDE
ncbi:MAG: hypothetical protein ACE37D_21920 [Pseudomonadales bacterium]